MRTLLSRAARGCSVVALLLAAAVLLPALSLAPPVEAQDTGGSFGGGDFGGGGGDYGGGGGDFGGGGSDYGGGGSDYGGGGWDSSDSSGSGGGDLSDAPLVCCVTFFVLFVAVAAIVYRPSSGEERGPKSRPGPGARQWRQMDVTALRIGIDWRSRKMVQGKLKELAARGDTKSPKGLAKLLHQTVDLLRKVELAWLYAGASNYSPMSPPQAEGIFRQLAIKARSRFKQEVIRSADGKKEERAATGLKAKPHEGQGVVVVTLIVAARREIEDLKSTADAQELRRALGRLGRMQPADMVALEVIWSPSEEEDRMSTLELEALYPDLSPIDPRSITGRIFCIYCGGPYAAELDRCPHCGATNAKKGGAADKKKPIQGGRS